MSRHDEFAAAIARAKRMRQTTPSALSARYDRKSDQVMIQLENGLSVGFHPDAAQGLQGATANQLSKIEITPSGYGLHFPRLDADVYLPALLEGIFGSKRWTAARLGQIGGLSRSKAKIAAARANGRRGGRPPKVAKAG